ncbi:XrtA system polysaccharide chain length determinant [Aquimonas sp.]|uniref:XrtA system polysaccharide chain length determinant n=1 Tax=Aquimonas sp. TaxID=1872588 RepID=UPI0037C0CC3E
MKNAALPGPANASGADLFALLPLLLSEVRRHGVLLLVGFCLIALTFLGVGIVMPRKYQSVSTILAGEANIIAPLMEGAAVPTGVTDRARIAREVIFTRNIMGQILDAGGWSATVTEPLARERMIEEIKQRTRIDSPGANLIRISYTDDVPERAFQVATRYADLFMSQSLEAKERESREAFEFIAARVEEYHQKLTDAEQRLKEFRSANLDARPGSDVDVRTRIAEVRSQIETARTNLSELQMRETALTGQISGEVEIADVRSRSSQFRARLGELQAQLDTLRLDYTDSYPDVVRVRHQMEDLQAALQREESAEASGARSDDSAAAVNPLYQQLRSDLARVRGDMAALRARITENEALLNEELDRGRRVADSEASLAELTRDYEVNRDIYQDLLRRRENARVSMSLDAERRGLTFRIQESAALPLQPTGLRLMHFAAAGIGLGAAVPLALLFALLQFDPRARNAQALAASLPVPVLVSIPEFRTTRDRRRTLIRLLFAMLAVGGVAALYVWAAISRGAIVL